MAFVQIVSMILMGTELLTTKDLNDIANPKTFASAPNDFKGATNLVTEINKSLGSIMQIVDKYQTAKEMINPQEEREISNISPKIEKGIQKGMANAPKPSLEIHAGIGAKYLKDNISNFIDEKATGKELIKQIKDMDDDVLTEAVKHFLKAHIKIK